MTEPHQQPQRPSGLRAFIEGVGLLPPRDGTDPYAHRRGEPRGFTVIWLAFLFLAAGAVYSSIGNPVFASHEGYRLASKVLFSTVGCGIITVWPVLRLAQQSPIGGGVTATARDLAIVLIPMQALLWPQILITGWSVQSVAASAALLAGWTLIVGAIIALAIGPARAHARSPSALQGVPQPVEPFRRMLAMSAIVAVALAAPAAGLLMNPGTAETDDGLRSTLAVCSPLTAPWELFEDRAWTGTRAIARPEHWKAILMTLVIGLVAWGVLLTTGRVRRVEDRSAHA